MHADETFSQLSGNKILSADRVFFAFKMRICGDSVQSLFATKIHHMSG